MKKRPEKGKTDAIPELLKGLEKKIDANYAEAAGTLHEVIELIDRRFSLLENHIGGLEIGFGKLNSELKQQMEGLHMRLDAMSSERAKYSDIEIIQKQIADIHRRLEMISRPRK